MQQLVKKPNVGLSAPNPMMPIGDGIIAAYLAADDYGVDAKWHERRMHRARRWPRQNRELHATSA
jgi:hypothetical protein